LGCPRNLADSEIIAGRLKAKGYTIVDTPRADIGMVNTCAFIKEAKEESIEAILGLVELKNKGALKKVIVSGCLPQRYGGELARHLKEVDGFTGRISLNHTSNRYRSTPQHYAYVKISDGCRNNCSYCVIPKIKGPYASRTEDSVLQEIDCLNKAGTSEINIIGQDTTLYGTDLGKCQSLHHILKKIIKHGKNIHWVRLLYLYPGHVQDELLELIAAEPKVCKYIDLPIQHINDRILKLMHRHTTGAQIRKLLEKVRKKIPGVAIRTALITGFPTERDEEFRELLDFVRESKFERLGVFVYSREEDTRAAGLKPQVPEKTRRARFDELMSLQQEISLEINRKYLGTVQEVLIEAEEKENIYLGRTEMDAPEVDGSVYVKSDKKLNPGEFVKVNINDTLEYDLAGDLA
ncbi:MAG: 30S ribosomal protein S12 methylthiotransferase RimO, partial [Candidatus Omnitrophica bacterium]|nr:30S ribosomal protein S12 methylthiotransferase RimO [Candidatus Omnitrophota bacterium]